MAANQPNRDDLRRGMTVEVEQEQENNAGEPLVGDIRVVLTDEHSHPQGIKVELESGVVGRVKEVDPQ